MAARSGRMRIKGVQKEMSRDDIELYSLALALQGKRLLRERRDNEAKAKARREITRRREERHER
jgi:hypothetical protein